MAQAPEFQPYENEDGTWRWELRNEEGKLVVRNQLTLLSWGDCIGDIDHFKQLVALADIGPETRRLRVEK